MGVVTLGFTGRALNRRLGTRATVVVTVIIPILASIVIIIPVIVPVIVVVLVVIPVVIIIAIIVIIMLCLIPILRDTSLTQRNQRRCLLPLADTLSLRGVIIMHRVAFVRDAHHGTAYLPAAVGNVVAVEGVC